MAGSPMTGGQTQKANPLDLGRYVGNPNHIAQQQLIKNNPNILDAQLNTTASMIPSTVMTPSTETGITPMPTVPVNTTEQLVPPQQPNINTLAAQGIKAAGAATGQGLSYTPDQVSVAGNSATITPQTLSSSNLNAYMNPYTDEVIKANEADVLRSTNMGLNILGAQAQAAGGFGGSRHGIAMGEMGRGMTDALARTSAGLRQAGFQNAQQAAGQDIANNLQSQLANQQGGQFDISRNIDVQRMNQAANLQAAQQNQANAMQAALANQSTGLQAGLANQSYNFQGQRANQQAGQQDIANRLQAALANQSAGLSGNAQRMGAAQQLGSLANLGFGMGQTVNNNLAQQGAMQQALQQVILDNARAKFAGYAGQPAAGIGYLSQALGNTPTTNTTTTTKTPGLFDYLTLGASMMPGS